MAYLHAPLGQIIRYHQIITILFPPADFLPMELMSVKNPRLAVTPTGLKEGKGEEIYD